MGSPRAWLFAFATLTTSAVPAAGFGTAAVPSALLLSPATAMAQAPRELARQNFNRGVDRYQAGDFEAALEAFQEAYRIAPHPNVRVNMANCYERLGRPAEAVYHFERFLAEADGSSPAQRTEVETALTRLRRTIGELALSCSPSDAQIRIDDGPAMEPTATRGMLLTAGTHNLTVVRDGYQTAQRSFIVAGGGTVSLDVVLDPVVGVASDPALGPLPPAAEPIEPRDEPGGGFAIGTPTIIAGAVTGALLISCAVTGAMALSAEGDFDDAVARSNDSSLSPQDREKARLDGLDAADSADGLATVTDLLLVAGLVGAGVTTYLFLSSDDGESDGSSSTVGSTISGGPTADGRGGAIAIRGRF